MSCVIGFLLISLSSHLFQRVELFLLPQRPRACNYQSHTSIFIHTTKTQFIPCTPLIFPEFEFEIKPQKNPNTIWGAAQPSWACLSLGRFLFFCFGTSIYVVKFITHTISCVYYRFACQKCGARWRGRGRKEEGRWIDSDERQKWMCATKRRAALVTLWRHQAHKRDSYNTLGD